jgi:hypothetical protein
MLRNLSTILRYRIKYISYLRILFSYFVLLLQAKSVDIFLHWVEQLKRHRLYRQHILTFGNRELPLLRPTISPDDVSPSVHAINSSKLP